MMLRRSMSTNAKNMYDYPILRMKMPSVEQSRPVSPCRYNFNEIDKELKCTQYMLREVLDTQKDIKQRVNFLISTTGTVIIGCPSFSFLMYCLMY
jgi:hypothetical protein